LEGSIYSQELVAQEVPPLVDPLCIMAKKLGYGFNKEEIVTFEFLING